MPPTFLPDRIEAGGRSTREPPPARVAGDDRWSAFIDPGMGSLFIDEPWLEMAPTPDKQAELLAGFSEIKVEEFERALSRLAPAAPRTPSASDTPRHESAPAADGKLSLEWPACRSAELPARSHERPERQPGPSGQGRQGLIALLPASQAPRLIAHRRKRPNGKPAARKSNKGRTVQPRLPSPISTVMLFAKKPAG